MTAASIGDALTSHPDGVIIALTVVSRSGKTAFDRVELGAARLRVAATPVDGAANAAVIRFLADVFGLPKGAVRIVAGQTGRRKRVLLGGLSLAAAVAALETAVGRRPLDIDATGGG